MSKQPKLSNLHKFNYAIGDFSSNIILAAINFYLLYFMINVGGLSPFCAAAVFLLTKLLDALTDYLMGILCDHTMSHNGRRRLYMLCGAIPFGLFFPLLWIVPNTSVQLFKFLYYFSILNLYDTIWTVVYIPYNSLLANITDDYDERTSINGWRVSISNLGMIVGSALFPLFADGTESLFYRIFGNEKQAFFFSSLIFGIVAGALMFLCALNVKERPCPAPVQHVSPLKTLKEFFGMKEFRNTLLHYALAMTGIDIVMGIYVFYLNDCLTITDGLQVMIFLSTPLAFSILSAPFWVRLSARYSKHRVYTISVVSIVTALLVTLFIPEKGYLPLIGFCVLSGFSMAAIQVLPFAAIPDIVEVDEYRHGVRREGSYFGVVQFAYNASSGVAMALVSLILGAFGYVENTSAVGFVQPDSALWAVRGILAFLPSVLFIVSAVFSKRANMDRVRFNDIKQKIADRK